MQSLFCRHCDLKKQSRILERLLAANAMGKRKPDRAPLFFGTKKQVFPLSRCHRCTSCLGYPVIHLDTELSWLPESALEHPRVR